MAECASNASILQGSSCLAKSRDRIPLSPTCLRFARASGVIGCHRQPIIAPLCFPRGERGLCVRTAESATSASILQDRRGFQHVRRTQAPCGGQAAHSLPPPTPRPVTAERVATPSVGLPSPLVGEGPGERGDVTEPFNRTSALDSAASKSQSRWSEPSGPNNRVRIDWCAWVPVRRHRHPPGPTLRRRALARTNRRAKGNRRA